MALSERSRVVLHTKLTQVVGDEEAVSDMLSEFPANDLERPATKEFVRAEINGLRAEMTDLSSSLRTDIASLRTEFAERFGALETRFHDDMILHLKWMIGLMITFNLFIATAVALAS